MHEISVRKAAQTHLPGIISVWKRNIKTANTPADIAKLFHSFKEYFFTVVFVEVSGEVSKTKVIGFVGGAIRMGHGHISGIAVDEEYRRKGIGRWLLNAMEKEFLAKDFDRVTLEVQKSNINAIRFYEKQGYKWSYIVKWYYADGEDAIVYEKKL